MYFSSQNYYNNNSNNIREIPIVDTQKKTMLDILEITSLDKDIKKIRYINY